METLEVEAAPDVCEDSMEVSMTVAPDVAVAAEVELPLDVAEDRDSLVLTTDVVTAPELEAVETPEVETAKVVVPDVNVSVDVPLDVCDTAVLETLPEEESVDAPDEVCEAETTLDAVPDVNVSVDVPLDVWDAIVLEALPVEDSVEVLDEV